MSESGGRLSPPKKSIDDLLSHLAENLQSYDGQYMVLGQPTPNNNPNHLWQSSTSSERSAPGCIQQPPLFKQQQQPNVNVDHMSGVQQQQQQQHNLFYNSTPGHNNFNMSYSGMNLNHQPQTTPQHYPTNLSNNYMHHQYQQQQQQLQQQQTQPMMRDYGLFSNQNEPMMSSQLNSNTFTNHQLIENLVGNWLPNQNQSGTYSPFGNLGGQLNCQLEKEERTPQPIPIQQQNTSFNDMPRQESILSNTTTRKPRMVAEVRPMRPSYSAVLTKSPPIPAQSNKNNKDSKVTTPPVSFKGDNVKSKSGKGKKSDSGDQKSNTPSGTLKRQHSGGEEPGLKNSQGNQQAVNGKQNQNTTAQWNYLDHTLNGEEYLDNDDEKFSRKESGRKSKRNKNKYQGLNQEDEDDDGDDKFENSKFGNKRNINTGNLQWGVWETESSVSHRNHEKKANKSTEDSKKSNTGIKSSEATSGKQSRKNVTSSSINTKKSQRATRRRDGHAHLIAILWTHWRMECSRLAVLFASWLFHLVWDIVAMSSRLMVYLFGVVMECVRFWCVSVRIKLSSLFYKKWWTYSFPWKKKRTKLSKNINLPSTGDEAIRRLLSCKEKDPYSILGVAPDCTDDDIKKYYRRQAILVHPDKNQQAGAEEAFKTLAHAFDLIGEPETRSLYDQRVKESHQVEQAWTELNDLLSKLSQKVEIATNTIRCTHCGGRHRRVLMERPSYAARFCSQCKIHHSAREGDIWAESWGMGLLWHYYACMEGAVYDITEWAACQALNLKHLRANSHAVQYRIVVGKQHPPPSTPSHHTHHPHCPNGSSDPDIEDFLNNLYHSSGGAGSGGGGGGGQSSCNDHNHHSHSRQRRKGGKKKK